VLSERVVREEQAIRRDIRNHVVGPVEHRGLDERERLRPKRDRISGFNRLYLPIVAVIVHRQFFRPFLSCNHCRIRSDLHHAGK
jgi:hypothetical protein